MAGRRTARNEVWEPRMAGNLRLLIAEDDELVVMGLTMVIEQLGHQVCATAQTAGQAVDLAEANGPDLALVDVALAEGSDGLAATREISGRLGVPVIVCSAHASPADAYAAGARHFLMKPFGIEALTEAMLSACRSGDPEAVFAA